MMPRRRRRRPSESQAGCHPAAHHGPAPPGHHHSVDSGVARAAAAGRPSPPGPTPPAVESRSESVTPARTVEATRAVTVSPSPRPLRQPDPSHIMASLSHGGPAGLRPGPGSPPGPAAEPVSVGGSMTWHHDGSLAGPPLLSPSRTVTFKLACAAESQG
jgi:hypothetical protein